MVAAGTGYRQQSFSYPARGQPELLFEHAGEILGILKSQRFGNFGDAAAAQQHGFGLLHKEVTDVGRCASLL